MRTWYLNEAYLTKNDKGFLIIKSKGEPFEKINNIQITIDHQNNCNIIYDDFHWRMNHHKKSLFHGDFILGDFKVEDVEPIYHEEKEWTTPTTEVFFWKKHHIQKYLIVKEGLVRLNKTPTRHNIQGNNWLIESQNGEIVTNIKE